MILYRPVGLEELILIFLSEMKRFPPRLPEQPIFYPVLNAEYATQIASRWNTKSGSLAGYVTAFSVNDTYVTSLPIKTVGATQHQELWVPREQLDEFNAQIEAQIAPVSAFFGEDFQGVIPNNYSLKGKNAATQFITLKGIHEYSLMDFHGEIAANAQAIFAHFPFWKNRSFSGDGVTDNQRDALLSVIRKTWAETSPNIPLSDC